MMQQLLGEYPAADDREQMGRFLRHAFPLGMGSFADLPYALKGDVARSNNSPLEAVSDCD